MLELFENTAKYKEGMIYGHLNHRYPDDMITKENVDKVVQIFDKYVDIPRKPIKKNIRN